VTLADGTQQDLTADGTGKEKRVAFKDRVEYARRCIQAKLTEQSVQCAAIRRGLVKIIPESILNQISYEEMEGWVCGEKHIDVDLIRRNTKLNGFKPEDTLIQDFWEFFESLSQHDRRRFVKFCYAIERLPMTDEDWRRRNLQFTILELKNNKLSADELLPEVSTCFFQMKLPKYTNKERMRKQIICAFTNDNESMNLEQDAHSREMRRDHAGEDRRNSYDD
jgi:E3 ubiquitin-protein ligase HECTD3